MQRGAGSSEQEVTTHRFKKVFLGLVGSASPVNLARRSDSLVLRELPELNAPTLRRDACCRSGGRRLRASNNSDHNNNNIKNRETMVRGHATQAAVETACVGVAWRGVACNRMC